VSFSSKRVSWGPLGRRRSTGSNGTADSELEGEAGEAGEAEDSELEGEAEESQLEFPIGTRLEIIYKI
jgi:hypothetical protein